MKRLKMILSVTALCLLASCGLTEVDERQPQPVVPPYLVDDSKVPVTYVLAFDYADGYEWHSDRDYGTSDCNMVLFANGRKVRKIPVGYNYNLLPDTDMHRVIGGDIYSDYSTDSHTVILKNGEEVFRYQSREMIVSMTVSGNDIYTLGSFRSGAGFSARKNGAVLVESSLGYPFSHAVLGEDGEYSFCYCDPIPSEKGMIGRYYRYSTKTGKYQIAVRDDIVRVWDAVPGLGYMASLVGIVAPVLIRDDGSSSAVPLGIIAPSITLNSCRFLSESSPALLELTVTTSSKKTKSASSRPSPAAVFRGVWTESACALKWDTARKAYGFRRDEDGTLSGVASGNNTNIPDIAHIGLDCYTLPESYAAFTEDAVSVRSGDLVVGLSSRNGKKPLLWSPDGADTLDVNGFISQVKLEMVAKSELP